MKKEKQEGNMWERAGRWRRNGIRPLLKLVNWKKYYSEGYELFQYLESRYNSSKLKKRFLL